MSSIGSVGSSSNAASQYQMYLERMKAVKAMADAPQDTAKGAQIETSKTQVDGDKDGD